MFGNMRNRPWRREKSREDSIESNSTQASSSIREFELFREFCAPTSPSWVLVDFLDYRCFNVLVYVLVYVRACVRAGYVGFRALF